MIHPLAPAPPSAWVIAVNMGYGHQRTAHPLRTIAPGGEVLIADDYPGMPESDKTVWRRARRFYEFASNARRVPVVGEATFAAMDLLQRILRFYPRRDLSRPDLNVRALYSLIRRGWGRHLIDMLKARAPGLPIVSSFFTPAFMAEFFDYPGDIYCVVCDADIARAWAPLVPASSRIRYFAPTRRAAERLEEYGVRSENVLLTGYPLPLENVGEDQAVLRQDLAQRIVTLDPGRRYLERYGGLVAEKVGELPPGPTRPLTIVFAIGGAGAQKEIAADILRSLKPRIAAGDVRMVVAAGIKPWVRDYVERAVRDCAMEPVASQPGTPDTAGSAAGGRVEILFAPTIAEYFEQFDRMLRTADILWTKPSELSFYCALGLPIVLSPPLGAQEKANREWLLRLGAGTEQDDPSDTEEWLFDLLESGWFAEAAMEGFVEGEALAAERMAACLRSSVGEIRL